MNGHVVHGTVDDAEAAALLCELRASPVVHTSALYPRPSFSHVHTHDLRLPSPHEILAQAEWDRYVYCVRTWLVLTRSQNTTPLLLVV
jgi:hypothetical protein